MNLPANAGDTSSVPVREDPTCCETTKATNTEAVSWSLGTAATEPGPHGDKPPPQVESSPQSLQLENARAQQGRAEATKNKLIL